MKRTIKTFSHEGEFLDDSVALLTRVSAENIIYHYMRDKGYVKVLDIDTIWSTYYNPLEDRWNYEIRAYGIFVGKRKAREYDGWSQGKLIPRNTRRVISNQ